MSKRFTTVAALGLWALASALLAADPALSLAELQAKGFVRPCAVLAQDEHGPMELLRNVVQGPNGVWTLVNYTCGAGDGTTQRGLWFQELNQASFRKAAVYQRDLEVAGNAAGDGLLFVNEPASGESNAFYLPAAAFTAPGRAPLPDLPGSLVDFQDLSPTGYVDLSALAKSLIPPKYNGRSMAQAAWLQDGRIGLFLYARNADEDDSWTGTAAYSVKDAKLEAVPHLPFAGLDWIGNIKVGESNGHIDLE